MNVDEKELLLDYLLGNTVAAEFCEEVLHVAHFWDDLIDKDKTVDDERINSSMWRALVELPRNAFYQAHFNQLHPVLMVAMASWMSATRFERDPEACTDKLRVAYAIRSDYLNVLVMAGIIVGGPAYGLRMADALREIFHKEGFPAYRKRLRDERETREQVHV